jgi:type II secretory pathway component PulJ
MFPRQQQGFTLLEVLLAGFILFITIATMTMVYRGALLSSNKAEESLALSGSLPFIRSLVTEQLREGSDDIIRLGKGRYGEISYTWVANAQLKGRPSLDILEINGEADRYEYLLWTVQLTLLHKSRAKAYTFDEISW